jgi:GT2 family glycosyltransferase/lipopolysaccharide/colanic/teichoic acid biosynthesis glycosyltransferase
MIEISIIIVNYNVRRFLEQSLDSIQKALRGIPSEIIVVDNGSNDGSAAWLRQTHPRVRLIENSDNRGFARANNQAIREARGEILCLINPDTLVREDTFRVCLRYLRGHSKAGAIGCKILNPDGSLQLSCRRSFPTPWVAFTKVVGLSRLFPRSRWFGKYNLTFLDPEKTVEVDAISGSFMVVPRRTVDDVGLLDERFFMYGEDLDWCYRIRQKGWSIVYLPETQIIHYKGQSAREAPFDSIRMFYGAMRLFVRKHFRRGWSIVPQWVLILGIALRSGISLFSKIVRHLGSPLLDLGAIQFSLILALFLRFGNLLRWPAYGPVNIVYSLVWIGSLFLLGLYKEGMYSSSKAFVGGMLGLVFNTSLTFFFPQYAFSRQVILTAGVLCSVFFSGWRLLIRMASRVRRVPFLGTVGKTLMRRRTLVVGLGPTGRKIAEMLRNRVDGRNEVVGYLVLDEKNIPKNHKDPIPVLGTLGDLERIASTHRIHEVIFSPETVEYKRILDMVVGGHNLHLDFKMVPRDMDVIIGRTSIDLLEDVPLVDLEYRIFSAPNRLFKRLFDIVAALCLAPAGILVWLFWIILPQYRFRRWKISDGWGGSLRVVRLLKHGKPLAKPPILFLSLPWILWGKMSMVGTEIVGKDAGRPEQGFKPGVTGLVRASASKHLTEEEKARYLVYYLRNHSLLLDIEILLKAVFPL